MSTVYRSLVAKADGNHEYRDWTPEEIAEFEAVQSAQLAQDQIAENKAEAQRILTATDWTQIPNSGLTAACVAAYEVYRTEVRAIRQNPTPDALWPVEPTREWE